MLSEVRIFLEGLPESVHLVADALDEALPDGVVWHEVAGSGPGHEVRVEGTVMPLPIAVAEAALASAVSMPMTRSAVETKQKEAT